LGSLTSRTLRERPDRIGALWSSIQSRLPPRTSSSEEASMTEAATIVREFYEALARGDLPAVLSLLDENIAWTEAESFPYYSGTWHGPQEVLENLLKPLARDWDEFSAKAHEFIAQGNRIVSLGTYSGTFKRTGRSFSAPFAHVWTVQGHKLTRFDMHTDTAKLREALKV
jgi:ketosteroid isomerase-like protein